MSEPNSRFWRGETSRRIEKRIIVEADLVSETPAHFGDGDANDLTDMPLLMSVDFEDKTRPLLTGATLTGALRAYLNQREFGFRADARNERYALSELLFGAHKGGEDDDGRQSALIIEDALGEKEAQIELRESVKLDSKTRTAHMRPVTTEDGQQFLRGELFDIQLWAAGTRFPLRFELLLMETPRQIEIDLSDYQRQVLQAFLTALEGLTDGSITLGARKNRGLGRFSIEKWRVKEYDLKKNSQALYAWLESGDRPLAKLNVPVIEHPCEASVFANTQPEDAREWLEIDFACRIDPASSLLIRDSGSPDSPVDMVHLRSNGRPVLSATSLTGALRARAERILNLINPDKTKPFLDELFGSDLHQQDNNKRNPEAKASRLVVEEYEIKEPVADLVQNRVSIDRFTGGARDTALFSQQPVFGHDETRLRIKWRLLKPVPVIRKEETEKDAQERRNHEFEAQAGLLLLLLKDLWTGDLPVGGEISVGRGRLQGEYARIALYNGRDKPQTWEIHQGKRPDNYQELEKFVERLWEAQP
jgi:CRISPR/Cas system CSM-associated protein Csm3 (group 7 of RAMP superfamily)